MAISYLGVQMIKLPLPLKKSLDNMNEQDLLPYTVLKKQKIQNVDILKSLGTEDYLQWTLEDTNAEKTSPLKYCLLFVTYYTGNPDQVPHVPEECYFGGGHQNFGSSDLILNINFANKDSYGLDSIENNNTKNVDTINRRIPARYLIFSNKGDALWGSAPKFPVFYLFKVNDTYAGNRNTTRAALSANLFGKYSYFSKIEWKFYNIVYGSLIYPKKNEAIAASEKLLSTVLPLLERDHWPDWEKANREN